MNSDKIKSEIHSKKEKIESELPLIIIILMSIFLITLAIVEKGINIGKIDIGEIDVWEKSIWSYLGLYNLGVFALISLTSLICGSLVGFIFGLPRVISENTSIYSNMYGDNSNLDQVSDWLLKILIGVGLAQLNELRNILRTFRDIFANMLGSSTSGGNAAVLLMVIFSVAGFLSGYLCTRRYVPLIFMEGLSMQHSIEESMDKDKEDIKKNAEDMVSENRKIIENIQNNQEGFCRWMEKVTKQMNLFEENQRKYYTLNVKNPSLPVLDCIYPVNGNECLEQIKKLKNEIKKPIEEKVSNRDQFNEDSSNNCSNKKSKSKLQIIMKNNKNEITEYTNKLANKNKQIMKNIESNQRKFACWMELFEDRLKAITDNQIYINNFLIFKIYEINSTT